MPIDKQARREAQSWYLGNAPSAPYDISGCPRKLSNEEAQKQLEQMRPEYYGKSARFITQCLSSSFSKRTERGDLGLVKWTGEPVEPSQITSFNDLDNALLQTLLIDLQDELIAIRTFDINNDAEVEKFQALRALEALNNYRNFTHGESIQDLTYNLREGYKTASSHIVNLIQKITPIAATYSDTKLELIDTLTKSHMPLMRVASLPIDVLETYSTEYLVVGTPFLARTARGTIDFDLSIIADLTKIETSQQPTIGCPVLFGKDQVKQLWQWGVYAAEKTNLI